MRHAGPSPTTRPEDEKQVPARWPGVLPLLLGDRSLQVRLGGRREGP